ncbi:hypothetical protein GYB22_08735 [bacterium]|nr:hypothetical protein [bacterium]
MKQIILSLTSLFIILSISSCKEDIVDPPVDNEQEVITTVHLIFTDSASSAVDTFSFMDADGPGGADPTIDSILLNSNSTYFVEAQFLNEQDPNDVEDITEEILEEGADHHICFDGIVNLNVDVSSDPADNNGFPVPVNSTWRTSTSETGSFTLLLKHKEGHSHQDCNEGETDVEVSFNTKID